MERWLIHLPFLGAAVAVSFDVGYFWGIDINFYVFTLWEHILFAIEALPMVLLFLSVTFFGGALGVLAGTGFTRLLDFAGFTIPKGVGARVEAVISRWSRSQKIAFVVLVVFGSLIAFFGAIRATPYVLGWMLDAFGPVLTGLVAFAVVAFLLRHFGGRWRTILLPPALLVGCTIAAFYFGHTLARQYVESSLTLHHIREGDDIIQGRLIRAGERGVLYVVADTRRVIFQKWDSVQRIESQSEGLTIRLKIDPPTD
jgi:hypothetical protein